MTPERIALSIILGTGIAVLAYLFHALTKSGAVTAFFVIAVSFLFGGIPCFCLLIFTFSVISVAGKLCKKRTPLAVTEKQEKEGARDGMQVLANGAPAVLSAILFFFLGEEVWIAVYAVAVGEALCDSLASEIGVLSKSAPRSLLTMRPVEPGESGGISLLGTFAATVGALLVAAFSVFFFEFSARFFCGTVALSLFGVFLDSLFGATVQAKRQCIVCDKRTEKRLHCGKPTKLVGGAAFVGNDLVNFVSNLISTALAVWLLSW